MKLVNQLLLTMMLVAALLSQQVVAGEVLQANMGREGQTIEPKSLMVPGSPVVVDFYSTFCPACLKWAPRLEQLAAKTNIVVKRININRPGFQKIDWKSPLARQFGIKMVPYFVLLDPNGKMIATGRQAMEIIKQQMQEVGIGSTASSAKRAFKAKVIEQSPAPAKEAAAPAPAKEVEASPPTMATVRKAKKAQGLRGYIFQDRNSKKFFLEDNEGDSYKFEGGQWVKIGAQKQPEKTADTVEVQKQVKSQSQAIEADSSPPTIATVRKARKAQGLRGYIFQDRNSKKFFLEDSEGSTYKFEGGQWIKLN